MLLPTQLPRHWQPAWPVELLRSCTCLCTSSAQPRRLLRPPAAMSGRLRLRGVRQAASEAAEAPLPAAGAGTAARAWRCNIDALPDALLGRILELAVEHWRCVWPAPSTVGSHLSRRPPPNPNIPRTAHLYLPCNAAAVGVAGAATAAAAAGRAAAAMRTSSPRRKRHPPCCWSASAGSAPTSPPLRYTAAWCCGCRTHTALRSRRGGGH